MNSVKIFGVLTCLIVVTVGIPHGAISYVSRHDHVDGGHGYGGGYGGEYGGGLAVYGGEHGGYGGGYAEHYDHHPSYTYDYGVNDHHTGDNKKAWETRHGDAVKGGYSLKEADGTTRVVEYTADDHHGFNAVVKRIGHAHHPQVYGHHEGYSGHDGGYGDAYGYGGHSYNLYH